MNAMDSMSGPDGATKHRHHLSGHEVRQHAGPWLIALGVLVKSLLAIATAIGLEVWGAKRMHDWIGLQIERYRLNPDHGFFAELMRRTSDGNVHIAALALVVYAVLHGAEAWGLWKDKAWASWLGVAGASFYLSITGFAVWNRPNWITLAALAINVIVVLVLAWNIRALRTRTSSPTG
jgi:uncharacterized membrane protein (DUF2068 family)